MKLNGTRRGIAGAVMICGALGCILCLIGCQKKKAESQPDSDTVKSPVVEEVFHANNDIAMTVRSIVDALKQKEPLDTAVYNFEGVLTDGSGAALYINAAGNPGHWRVVVSDDKAVIENLDLGDFTPDNIRLYVCEEIGLTEEDIIKKGEVKGPGGAEMTNYSFDGGEIHFESAKALTADGNEGPVLSIVIFRNPPEEESTD